MAMTQRTRSLVNLLVLAALTAAAGLFAYYGVHQKQEKEKAAKELKAKLFPDLEKAKLTQLTVTAKGQTTVLAYTKQPEAWNLVSPVNALADKAVVDALVEKLVSLQSKAVVAEKCTELDKYGLGKPSMKLVAKTEDGKEHVLRTGDENSFDNSMYAATADSTDVLQLEGGFKWALEKDTFDLRDKRVVPVGEGEVAGLEVTLDGVRWAVNKADGQWKVTTPYLDAADEQTVNRLVGAVRNLRALRFETDTASAEQVAAFGLATPRLDGVVTLTSGTKVGFSFSQAELGGSKKTFGRRREATFIAEVPESVFTDLTVKPADLRDKTLVAFEKNQVAKATFGIGTEAFTLERTKVEGDAGPGEDWTITAPTPGNVRKWKMSSVLWGLSSLKAKSIVEDQATDLAQYGLDKPTRTVVLFGQDGKELASVAFGKDNAEGNVFARNTATQRVLEIEKARMGELPASRADLEEPAAAPDAGVAK